VRRTALWVVLAIVLVALLAVLWIASPSFGPGGPLVFSHTRWDQGRPVLDELADVALGRPSTIWSGPRAREFDRRPRTGLRLLR
jgi:hypothetical protein